MNKDRLDSPGWRKTTVERIDEFLAKEEGGSNAELIRRLRTTYFADVDEVEKSGEVKIPD